MSGIILYWLLIVSLKVIPFIAWCKGEDEEITLHKAIIEFFDIVMFFEDTFLNMMLIAEFLLIRECGANICKTHLRWDELDDVIYILTLTASSLGCLYSSISMWIFCCCCCRKDNDGLDCTCKRSLSLVLKILLALNSTLTFASSLLLMSNDYPGLKSSIDSAFDSSGRVAILSVFSTLTFSSFIIGCVMAVTYLGIKKHCC